MAIKIETEISQFKHRMHNGKVRIRGLGKVRNGIILMAMGINIGRIWAYLLESNQETILFSTIAALLLVLFAISLPERSAFARFHAV